MGCCQTLTGIIKDCSTAKGGIKRVWIKCYEDEQPVLTDEKISDLKSVAADWKEYQFRRVTGMTNQFTSTEVVENGTYLIESVIDLQFRELTTANLRELDALLASEVVLVVQDMNQRYWYFGFDQAVTVTASTGVTGINAADFNGITVALTDQSDNYPYELDTAAIDQLLDTAAA